MTSNFKPHEDSHWWLDRCFLYVGRMADSKGVYYILRAWLAMAREWGEYCPPIWLVGGFPHEIDVARSKIGSDLIRKYEQMGKMRWWGYLDASGISTLLLKTYVLVTHSLYEPGGRVVLEALSQGIPVIATPHGLAADLIVDWHTGFIVNHGDIRVLKRRMEHFALQPFLRHAMGRVAQQAASTALRKWDFLKIHEEVYRRAIEGRVIRTTKSSSTWIPGASRPQILGGVYPFEGEHVGEAEVSSFLIEELGIPSSRVNRLSPESTGRSIIWLAEVDGRKLVIKHAPTTYRRRSIWDRGFGASSVEKQEGRISNEVLASKCQGVAPLLASCARTGLLLRPRFEPIAMDGCKLESFAAHLFSFHNSKPVGMNLDRLQRELDRQWTQMEDDNFYDELNRLEKSWRANGYWWHPWQSMSLRIGWRWLDLGLRRSWLSLPPEIANDVISNVHVESAVAEKEPVEASFGVCHGDCEPDNFCSDERGSLFLIDCERFHPGYFGADWSTLTLALARNVSNKDAVGHFKKASRLAEPLLSSRLFVSWLRWQTVMDMCRAHVLLGKLALETSILRWRQLESIRSTP